MVAARRGDFDAISSRFGIDKVTARLLVNRDVVGDREIEKYLHGSVTDFYSPALMKDLERAAEILIRKIREKKKIRIIGDYDIDGIMATYILSDGLQRAGADVDYAIPERLKDGYGINENLVRDAFTSQKDTILTCDNGIAASEQIRLAKDFGMTVIVTDHHNVPYTENGSVREYILPKADAVVDPKQKDCAYPYKELCGAAIAWKLIVCLYEKLGLGEDPVLDYLPFAAIATVGDVVDLKDENRIIVKEGLKRLHRTEHIGLSALIEKCRLDKDQIDTYHIGFVLGPCLNASGRLDTAVRALELMREKDRGKALIAAQELRELNEIRKAMTEEGVDAAVNTIENSSLKQDKVLVVYLKDCHESLAGIIAGRLRERYNRPAFVLTDSEDGIKGSGRSVEEYSMYDELTKVNELFTKFGGHPMAAGISMENGKAEEFRKRINEQCTLSEDDLTAKVHLDMRLPLSYLSEELIGQFEVLKPFGKGNTRPLFADKDLTVESVSIVGKNQNVLKLRLRDSYGTSVEGICFHKAEEFRNIIGDHRTIAVCYYPSVNEYKGRRSVQIVISDLTVLY